MFQATRRVPNAALDGGLRDVQIGLVAEDMPKSVVG